MVSATARTTSHTRCSRAFRTHVGYTDTRHGARAITNAGLVRNPTRALLFAKRASARATPETRIDQRAVVTIEPEPDDRSVAIGLVRSGAGRTTNAIVRTGQAARFGLGELATPGRGRQTGTALLLSEPGPLAERGGLQLAVTH